MKAEKVRLVLLLINLVLKTGRLIQFIQEWLKITSDPVILKMISEATIPLENLPEEKSNFQKNQIQGNLIPLVNEEIL